ncbi:MAG: tetratricopeptide repeat protein [Desulfuromonadales bacterium]|nr:tetratricopeptide repeat protein [Desulfuromonadales bacterium]
MSLTDSERFAATADAFATANTAAQSQRAQIAQYAIQKAAGYLQNSNNDAAIKEFKKALAFDPQNTTAHTYLGKIYLNQGKTAEAIKEFKSVVQNDRTSVTARNNLGNAYLQAKQYTNAEKEFKTAAKMDPTQPLADYTLGILYTQTDRFSEAENQFNKVAKVSPRDGNVFYALGSLFNKTGRSEEAVKNLEKALTLKKDFPNANFELGSAYAKLGNTDKAEEQLSILQTKDTNLYNSLSSLLNTPKMSYIDSSMNNGFNQLLGPGTPLWMLDPSLMDANASKKVSVAIAFNNEMDIASVMNPANWEISRAKSADGGYYNNSMPTNTDREVSIPKQPFSITYDPTTRQANVTFTVQQNANGDATIDPSHLVFKFSGTDKFGRQMDTTGDQIDGYATNSF